MAVGSPTHLKNYAQSSNRILSPNFRGKNLKTENHHLSAKVPGENSIKYQTLRIQVCPKEGINPTILLWGWDWDHQTYSREGYGFLGKYHWFTIYLHPIHPSVPHGRHGWELGETPFFCQSFLVSEILGTWIFKKQMVIYTQQWWEKPLTILTGMILQGGKITFLQWKNKGSIPVLVGGFLQPIWKILRSQIGYPQVGV